MDELHPQEAAASRRFLHTELITLAIAAPAMLAVAAWFGSWAEALRFLREAPLQVLAGYSTMLLLVLLAAEPLGPGFARRPGLLALWNLLLFTAGATVGCITNWFLLGGRDQASYLWKPLGLLLTFGLVPTLVVGHLAVLLHVAMAPRSRG